MSDYKFYIIEPGVRDDQYGILSVGNLSYPVTYLKYEYYFSACGVRCSGWDDLTTIEFPNLTSIDPQNLQAGSLYFNGAAGLSAINAPKLIVTGGDITIISCPALTAISFPSLIECAGDLAIGANDVLRTISAPLLRSTNRSNLTQGAFELIGNATLTSVSCPSLTSIGTEGQLVGSGGCPALSTLSLPALVHAGDILFTNFTALRNVDLSSFIPTPGKTIVFSNINLTTASKDLILARCVANPAYTSGTISIGGDPLDAAGITSRATLTARGVTVVA